MQVGAAERGAAVDVGRLAGGATLGGRPVRAASHTLDEHLDDLAAALLGPLAGQLLDQLGQACDAGVDDVLRQVVRQLLGLGPVLVGVAEHPDRVQARRDEEALELGDVGLGLAGEADDDVAAHGRGRVTGADLVQQRQEGLGAAEPSHPPQDRGRGVLEAHVEVRRYPRGAREHLHQAGPHLGRLQVGQPDPLDPLQRGQLRQQGLEQPQVAQVLAVGRGVLADQHQLAHAVLREPARLGHHVGRAAADERAPEARDRAEGAAAVAPAGELERGDRAVVEATAYDGGTARVAGQPDVDHPGLHRLGPLDGADRQELAAIAGRVAGQLLTAEDAGQGVGQ